jgi:hypothetical protein
VSSVAFIGVLACSRAADGQYPEAERTLLDLICRNHPFCRALATDDYEAGVRAIKARIDEIGWRAAMSEYLKQLPQDWGYPTLLSAIDLCLIDAEQDDNEIICLATIAGHFGIPASHVDNFLQWFRIKNGMPAEAQPIQAAG